MDSLVEIEDQAAESTLRSHARRSKDELARARRQVWMRLLVPLVAAGIATTIAALLHWV